MMNSPLLLVRAGFEPYRADGVVEGHEEYRL
jgi:hypothetical protein